MLFTFFTLALSLFTGCKDSNSSTPATGIQKVNHVVVIYMENHSFDNLYGEYAGANGLSNATTAQMTQVDSNGNPYTALPMTATSPFPANLANKPWNLDAFIMPNRDIPDLVHRYYQEQMQIDGGKMDKFALVSDVKGESMGYWHTAELPLLPEAKKYVLCDNFFHSAFGGSFLNHQYLIAAAAPTFPNAPTSVVAKLDANGNLISDGFVTPDGYAVNTCYTVNTPHPSTTAAANLVPNQTGQTIGDLMNTANVSWAWYSGGWNNAVAGHPDSLFQFHHQPFAYYANYADGTPGRAAHLKDETDFMTAAQNGTLPAVSFVKPLGEDNEHPGYTDILTGENHAEALINAVRNGPNWNDCVIIITYDEHGGQWDHVAPPKVDKWGPGLRVPALIISPFAKQGVVDHTQYETCSILSFIEQRWNLKALSTHDGQANPLANAFSF
jgi:phospholipase C